MRRFRRVHGVEALAREMPLALHFFDCLMADGRSLIDAPYAERWEALDARRRAAATSPSARSSHAAEAATRSGAARSPPATRA